MSRWVAAQMGLSRPPTPSIAQVPAATLSRMVWGGPPPPGAHLRIESLYERGADTIYLRDDWDGADVVQRSHLVHELVHHFQHFHGIVAACAAALEMQAYAVQVKWLAEQGIADGYAALGTDEATVRLLALCP